MPLGRAMACAGPSVIRANQPHHRRGDGRRTRAPAGPTTGPGRRTPARSRPAAAGPQSRSRGFIQSMARRASAIISAGQSRTLHVRQFVQQHRPEADRRSSRPPCGGTTTVGRSSPQVINSGRVSLWSSRTGRVIPSSARASVQRSHSRPERHRCGAPHNRAESDAGRPAVQSAQARAGPAHAGQPGPLMPDAGVRAAARQRHRCRHREPMRPRLRQCGRAPARLREPRGVSSGHSQRGATAPSSGSGAPRTRWSPPASSAASPPPAAASAPRSATPARARWRSSLPRLLPGALDHRGDPLERLVRDPGALAAEHRGDDLLRRAFVERVHQMPNAVRRASRRGRVGWYTNRCPSSS